MDETQRKQIKGALLKCAEENENKVTPTFNVVVSSVCKSAVERIEELERENAELKADNAARKFAMAMSEKVERKLRKEIAELNSRVTSLEKEKKVENV